MYSFTNRLRTSSLFGVAAAIQGLALVVGSCTIGGLCEPCSAGIVNGGFEDEDANGDPTWKPWDANFANLIEDFDDPKNIMACINGGSGITGWVSQTFDCRDDDGGTGCLVEFWYRTYGDFEGEATLFEYHAEVDNLPLPPSKDEWTPVILYVEACERDTVITVTATSGTICVDDFSSHCIPAPGTPFAVSSGLLLIAHRRRR